jgi:hypothetical protein
MARGNKFTAEQIISKLRDELLNREVFDTLWEAKVKDSSRISPHIAYGRN